MANNVFSTLIQSNAKKLYLDSKTADVRFVFGAETENVETVPAHKNILSISSPMFDTMFYGSLPEQSDVPIVDASAEAFKEFLQFFYLNTITLTSDHIAEVCNLCKKYELVEALATCESPLQQSLTNNIDEMCSGYALAILLELTNTIQFCEQKIKLNAVMILKSTSFLECSRDILDKILQLVTSKCSPSAIVDACMAWAKAECARKGVEETPANLKAHLGQSFDRIPFAELGAKQFGQFVAAYSGLLDEANMTEIVMKVMTEKETKERSAATCSLICDRRTQDVKYDTNFFCIDPLSSIFISNKRLLLSEIHCGGISSTSATTNSLSAFFYNGNQMLQWLDLTLIGKDDYRTVLKEPIQIMPHTRYEIKFSSFEKVKKNGRIFYTLVRLRDDIQIQFNHSYGPVSCLVFQYPLD